MDTVRLGYSRRGGYYSTYFSWVPGDRVHQFPTNIDYVCEYKVENAGNALGIIYAHDLWANGYGRDYSGYFYSAPVYFIREVMENKYGFDPSFSFIEVLKIEYLEILS